MSFPTTSSCQAHAHKHAQAVASLGCLWRNLASDDAVHYHGLLVQPILTNHFVECTGDMAEYRAIRSALPGDHVRINSTKSLIGHLLGAAGAVEAVATVQAMQSGIAYCSSLLSSLSSVDKSDVLIVILSHPFRNLVNDASIWSNLSHSPSLFCLCSFGN